MFMIMPGDVSTECRGVSRVFVFVPMLSLLATIVVASEHFQREFQDHIIEYLDVWKVWRHIDPDLNHVIRVTTSS